MLFQIFLLSTFTWSVGMQTAHAGETEDRQVDRAALDTQARAITKLKQLLGRSRGTEQEAAILLRLAESQHEAAAVEFRLQQGLARSQKKNLNDLVVTLDRLISRFGDFDRLDQALFFRAQAFDELEKKDRANADYSRLVQTFPQSLWAIQSHMALADMAIDAGDHAKAIAHLKEVEKFPEDHHYPFALYKLAWGHYNLKLFTVALSYLERNVRFYDARVVVAPNGERHFGPSDEAIRETSLLDSALFFVEALEAKTPDHSVSDAYDAFKKLEKGPLLGKMLVRFAKLLRSHRHEAELLAFSQQMAKKEAERPETLEILLTVLEHQFNQHRFQEIAVTSRDLVELCQGNLEKFKKTESYAVVTRTLGETAERLQAMTVKNKKADEVGTLNRTLNEMYGSLIAILEVGDSRIPKIHYNLAEAQFELGRFKESTSHYRWVIEKASSKDRKALPDVEVKAIASRYEELREQGSIPKEIKAWNLADDVILPLEGPVAEWITWVDSAAGSLASKPATSPAASNDAFDTFAFEAVRTLYSQKRIVNALKRMTTTTANQPKSKFATAAATLVIDTYVVTQDWAKIVAYSEGLLKADAWKSSPFAATLRKSAADAFFKTVEFAYQAKKTDEVLKLSRELERRYPESARTADALFLAAQSAQAAQNRELATELFGRVMTRAQSTDPITRRTAVLARAQLMESSLDFEAALADYEAYLKLDTQAPVGIQKKRIQLSWVLGKSLPECAVPVTDQTSDEIRSECRKRDLLARLLKAQKEKIDTTTEEGDEEADVDPDAKDRVKDALADSKETKAVSALLELRSYRKMAFRSRLVLVRAIAQNWEFLDPLSQIQALPLMNRLLPEVFAYNRGKLSKLVPLKKPSPQAIARRMEWIREFELTAAKVSTLPWTALRASYLAEMGKIYAEFVATLRELPLPQDLPEAEVRDYQKALAEIVDPFTAKAAELTKRAAELDGFKKMGSQGNEINEDTLVDRFDDLRWLDPSRAKKAGSLQKLWLGSWQKGEWARVAFLTEELARATQISTSSQRGLRALLLARLGADAEARIEFEQATAKVLSQGGAK